MSGTGEFAPGDGGSALEAAVGYLDSVALDAVGNLYLSDGPNNRVRKIDRAGVITTFAGTGESGYSGDGGPATTAQLRSPRGLALDAAGNLYIADTSNHRVRRVDRVGTITTIAGTGEPGFSGDGGLATAAQFRSPQRLALDAAGNLYIADTSNDRVRRVDRAGVITTIAGSGERGYSGDGGPATAAQLRSPRGLVVDATGDLYIADSSNHRVRMVDRFGTITTVAGTGEFGYSGDGGPATAAQIRSPLSLALDAVGNLFIADAGNFRVRTVDPRGVITTVAGTGNPGRSGDGGPATAARLTFLRGLAVDATGNLFIADTTNRRVRRVDTSGRITTVAGTGNGRFGGDGGPAASARLFDPQGVALDTAGNIYLADSDNHRVRRVDRAGVITTIAGTGRIGSGGDGGPATAAQLNFPRGMAVDAAGNLFIADTSNRRVRRVDRFGTITTVAGTGEFGSGGDGGPATTAQLAFPQGLAVDGAGNLFIADTSNHRVRMVDHAGVITTVAGTGERGYGGDGGPATAAQLASPQGLAVDAVGDLYIADTSNRLVRRMDRFGTIATFAGTGERGYGGDGGPATAATFMFPGGLAVDDAGSLFIADYSAAMVRRVDQFGAITTVAGVGTRPGYGGDGGPAKAALLASPWGLAVDAAGHLYIADRGNHRVRRVFQAGSAIGPGHVGPADDHGNDASTATRLALNSFLGGVIETGGDEDWFRLETSVARDLKVRTTGSLETIVTLFDSSDRQLDTGFNVPGLALEAEAEVPAGVYYVRVQALRSSDTGSYEVHESGEAVAEQPPPARTGVISTVAGPSEFAGPTGVDVDGEGNLYVADFEAHRVLKVDPNGLVTTVAGTGTAGYSGDGGPATSAQLRNPSGVAVDSKGNIYIADLNNKKLRRVDPAGRITTVAECDSWHVAVDAAGSVYFNFSTSTEAGEIRRLDTNGNITTVAGTGVKGYGGDFGPATLAQLSGPNGFSLDATGNLYIADLGNARVRRVDPAGTITTVAGTGEPGYDGDGGPATNARVVPFDVTVDAAGNLYIASWANQRVRRVNPDGRITTVAGSGPIGETNGGYGGDGGPATSARLNLPLGVAVDVAGNLYIADARNRRVRKVTWESSAERQLVAVDLGTSGDSVTLVRAEDGSWWLGSDPVSDGAEVAAANGNVYRLTMGVDGIWSATYVPREVPLALGTSGEFVTLVSAEDGTYWLGAELVVSGQTTAVSSVGVIYTLSMNAAGVWTAYPDFGVPTHTATITTFAGTGLDGYGGDGSQATSARLSSPTGTAVDAAGNLYIADRANHRVRKVDAAGTITTVAGSGSQGYSGDGGPAVSAQLNSPVGVAADAVGNLYIADTFNGRVRKVDTAGKITTVAGTGRSDFSGDGGPATSAELSFPFAVAVDATGNLYIADRGNHRVRMVDAAGVITTVAGSRQAGPTNGAFGGDGGPATSAQLNSPAGIAVDAVGNLYIADRGNHRVRMVGPSGEITTLAGTGDEGFGGDGGPPTSALLSSPAAVAVTTDGDLYIADSGNNRVRLLAVAPAETPRVEVRLGITGESVTIVRAADGSYWLDESLVESGKTTTTATNGNVYTLSMGEDGTWSASYVPSTGEVIVGDTGIRIQAIRDEAGSWTAVDPLTGAILALTEGGTIAVGPNAYVLSQGNDGIWTASPVRQPGPPGATPLALNSSVDAAIESPDGEDWFRLVTSERRHLKVRTTGTLYTVGTLFDASERQLAQDELSGSGNEFALEAEVPAGVYYVRVRAYGVSQTGSYTIEEFGEPAPAPTPVTGTISTVAGSQGNAIDVALDANGNLYIADELGHVVRKVDVNGNTSTLAGTGVAGYSGDGGPATSAQLDNPIGVAVDAASNLYIAEWGNHRVRKVDASGVITTVAGTGTQGFAGDGGPASNAQLSNPLDLALDASGNLFIADHNNSRVRKVDPNGIITTVAQSAGDQLYSVAVDAVGNVYFGTAHQFSRVDPNGTITTVAGTGLRGYGGDGGPATSAQFDFALSIAVDANGNLYIADTNNFRVRRVDPNGIITTVAGTGSGGYSGDGGPANSAQIGRAQGMAVDANGNLYIADTSNFRVRKVTFSSRRPAPAPSFGVITTVAGSGPTGRLNGGYGGDGGAATDARLNNPNGIDVDSFGNLFVVDGNNHRVRKVDAMGVITTVAGGGPSGLRIGSYSGDGGPATDARLNSPQGLAVDATGNNLFIADFWNNRVRRVDSTGVITTVAGPPVLNSPADVALDATGNVYIADTYNHRVRRVAPEGVITTVAGSGPSGVGNGAYGGDGGPAIDARLNEPWSIALDTAGNLFVADTGNDRVRKIDPEGIISTVARANSPLGVAVDSAGNLYFADTSDYRVRMVAPDGAIRTVAGAGEIGFRGDGGLATDALLDWPTSVAVDVTGNLYITDSWNHRVRKATLKSGGLFEPQAVEVALGTSGSTVTLLTTEAGDYTLDGEVFRGGDVMAENGNTYTLTLADGNWSATYVPVVVNVPLGTSGDMLTITMLEDRSYEAWGEPLKEGDARMASNGNEYRLWMGEDGIWTASYVPSEQTVLLGTSGETVTVVRAEDGSCWLGSEEVREGSHVTASNGNVYSLSIGGDGMCVAEFVVAEPVTVALGLSGESVAIQRAEDGTFWLDAEQVVSGTTVQSSDGRTYRLSMADGVWLASYVPSEQMVELGASGERVTLVLAEDGSWWLGTDQVVGGATITSSAGVNYTLSIDEEGMWSASPFPSVPPVDDHGNDPTSATPMALGSSLAGAIETAGDEDWFRLETRGQWHVKVRTTGSLDTVGTLFDESGRQGGQLAHNNDGGSGTNFALEADVPAGVYFVRVRAFSSSQTGRYIIEEHGEPAVVPSPPVVTGKVYWTDWDARKIQRANLDGSGVEDLVTTGLSAPTGLELDLRTGKMYWTDFRTNKIQRANLDGSGVEDLVTAVNQPTGLALDTAAGKMYWAAQGPSKIQRANVDGSGLEDLVTTGLTAPVGLGLDVDAGKIYWTDPPLRKVQRANLDGSSVEDLVTGLRTPVGLTLDLGAGKIYWTDSGTDKVQRANLEGSAVEDLVTAGLSEPSLLSLDLGAGKMYWTDSGTDKVQRANLDGSGVEDLVTGLSQPVGLTLALVDSSEAGGTGQQSP
ncbi:MAG: hypothetical protein OXN89_24165 [Bryobacterales bacterium]|nr:hypothetical protein [Bryobacterales bacterium]